MVSPEIIRLLIKTQSITPLGKAAIVCSVGEVAYGTADYEAYNEGCECFTHVMNVNELCTILSHLVR